MMNEIFKYIGNFSPPLNALPLLIDFLLGILFEIY